MHRDRCGFMHPFFECIFLHCFKDGICQYLEDFEICTDEVFEGVILIRTQF